MTSEQEPYIGVVVPIHDVEPYLEECLTSIARQSIRELDVVMVDDGSTDASAEIAEAFSREDPRFRLISQPNGGLGQARNVGADAVRGRFLAFVDSDDVLPGHALELLTATLERTGSDIVSGNVRLLTEEGLVQSPMHRRPMGTTRLRTHITRDHLLLYDRLVPNKVFRRRFWDEHGFRFPEGVLYEDIPVTLPAHFLASSVDVVSEPVYYWRQRAGGALSITQRRTELAAVTDRFAAVESVSRFLGSRPEPKVRACKRKYDEVALRSDLRIFINVLDEADDEFRARFIELARSFLAGADRTALDGLPAMLRLKWHLAERGMVPELLQVLEYDRRRPKIPVTRRLWHHYAKYPFWGDRRLRVPRRVFRLGEELAARAQVHTVTWRRGKLHITGHAYIANMGTRFPWSSVKVLAMREPGSGATRVAPAWTRRCPDADEVSRDPHRSHRWSGFSGTIDPKRLRRDGRYVDGTWLFAAGVYDRGVLRRAAPTAASSGSGAHPPWHYVTEDVRVVPLVTHGGTLRLRVETVRARLTGHRMAGDCLEVRGTLRGGVPDGAALVLRRRAGTVLDRYPVTPDTASAGGFRARIPLRDLIDDMPAHAEVADRLPDPEPDQGFGWRLDLSLRQAPTENPSPATLASAGTDDLAAADITEVAGDPMAGDASGGVDDPAADDAAAADDPAAEGSTEPEEIRLVLDNDVAEGLYAFTGKEFVVYRSPHGYAWLKARTPRPVITEAAWKQDGTLVLAGEYPPGAPDPAELVLRSRDRNEERAFALSRRDGRFHAELPLSRLVSLGGVLPLAAGRWDVRVRRPATPAVPAGESLAVPLDHAALDRLPVETTVNGRRYVFREQGYDVPIVEAHSDLRPGERGAYRQLRTRVRHYRAPRRLRSLRPAVLYDSYSGKQYSDSPRAIHEELVRRGAEVEHLWLVRDAQVEVPETARPVRLWGAEWYEAMARSRYIVTNAHLPEWFVRRPGQVVVQTWHGTPLKRIGFDIEDVQFANPRYLEKVAKEVRNWSCLVSPNAFSTPILRRAFRYEGEIIETGYPRNDMLASPDRDMQAERIRERLGLPPGKRAVLYAPTWRDDSYYGPGKYRLDLQLDLERAAAELGDDHVLLIRRHPNVVDTVPEVAGGFVRDVSAYPDIAELFLVADVLLTDYSSLMFDYANTGRPMLFFTYDLEHYRDELRGFYFHFEREAPGPLLKNSDEVIGALRSIDEVERAYAVPYKRFIRRFCELDDGKAARRVADRILQTG
ncbi:bifunctional glycosyltransferase/CDP-glycerol:glycerophosphate glycerophosphotransferase [Actinomadura formosensis]|uniref:bifunctional glycosyltransferase/CDP-glycerol:glycerophosphate glycerophosphotransferase n=1 Tax=Actinomadura formosensis TaxID=60706 RepID=UPI00082EE2E0|nr:bifunctional glycosyltransferase family 2 protein/CDP-glycerol:glycerophosphate glycerophosphotransferase [Actinomadura formosensis]